MGTRNLLIAVAGLATLFSTNLADAQTRAVDGPVVSRDSNDGQRRSYIFGMSVGRGSIAIDCRICDDVDPLTEAFSFSAHAGLMLTQRLAIVGEFWTIRYNNRGSDWFPDSRDHAVVQNIGTVSGQLWVTSRLYLRAGFGVGHHSSDSLYTKPDIYESNDNVLRSSRGGQNQSSSGSVYAPATTFGVGFEFAHTNRFAADVQFRVGRTAVNDDKYSVSNTGLTFGVAWY